MDIIGYASDGEKRDEQILHGGRIPTKWTQGGRIEKPHGIYMAYVVSKKP